MSAPVLLTDRRASKVLPPHGPHRPPDPLAREYFATGGLPYEFVMKILVTFRFCRTQWTCVRIRGGNASVSRLVPPPCGRVLVDARARSCKVSLHAAARVLAPSKEAFDTPPSPPPRSDKRERIYQGRGWRPEQQTSPAGPNPQHRARCWLTVGLCDLGVCRAAHIIRSCTPS